MGKKKRHNFRELQIWHRSRALVKVIYEVSGKFPSEEKFGLTNQIRRCAVSVPSNIAEGCGRGSDAQLAHYLDVAHGSCCELETQLLLASDLGLIHFDELTETLDEIHQIQKMILGFKDTL